MSLISRLRELPLERRKRVAFYSAGGITVLIVGVWLLFPGEAKEAAPVQSPAPYLEGLGQSIGGQFDRLRTGFNAAIEGLESLGEDATTTDEEGSTTTAIGVEGAATGTASDSTSRPQATTP